VPKRVEKLSVERLYMGNHFADDVRASLGVSEAAHMRQRRWRTMPESVCTM